MQLASELARPRLAELGLAPLSALGLEALAARVAFRARQQNDLAYFNPVANLPGFPRALSKTLRDLRLAGVTPDQLGGVGAPADDLANLLTRYEAELAEGKLADMAAILRLATEAAAGSHRWSGLPVVLLDIDLPSAAHRDLFVQLATLAPEVFIAVNRAAHDETFPAKQIGLSPEDIEDLDSEVPESALDHLRRNLFNPAVTPFPDAENNRGFEYFSAPGEGLEAVEIARRILRMCREGIPFDDVAILLRNPERYQPMIDDALRRAAIPAYFSQGTTRPDPSGRAFLAVLGCAAENLSATRFAEYLSLGQLPELRASPQQGSDSWVAPSDELLSTSPTDQSAEVSLPDDALPPTPRGWEKLLVDAKVIDGDRWKRRLNGLEAEWELQLKDQSEPEGAAQLQTRLEKLRNLKSFALPIISALADLAKFTLWSEWLTQLSSLANQCLRDPSGVLSLLADLAPMGEVGPVTLEEVFEVLSDRLQFLRREPPARRWGQVFVGSVDEVRASDFRIVFLPGLAEGLFPQRPLEDPLLLDEFRKIVNQADGALALRNDLVRTERLRLHVAVGAARERLIASYPRMEVAEARPRVPSFYALELPRAIFGTIPELNQFERQAREAAPARLNWPAPREPLDAIDDAEYDLVAIAQARNPDATTASRTHYLTIANPHLIRSLRGRWARWHKSWRSADGLITTDPGALAALDAYRLTARAWSPSALENFSSCPYKFALRGIYRLRPREDSTPLEQLDPMTRGSLFHEVQFQLFQQLQSAGLLPVTPANLTEAISLCDQALQKIADEYKERLAPAIPRVWDSEIEDLRTDLRGWLNFVAVNETSWTPTYFERAFGNDAELSLTEGVRLRGRIDLLEQSVANPGTWRVTDHKTGKRPETVPRWVGGGKSLQPLLYALAAEQFLSEASGGPATVESGRLLFATQKGQYTPIEIRVDDRARQFLVKLLGNIDASISSGFLPPIPDKEVCGFCDYRIVCGPYEERRLLKKDRRDDRLDTLYEIRSMA